MARTKWPPRTLSLSSISCRTTTLKVFLFNETKISIEVTSFNCPLIPRGSFIARTPVICTHGGSFKSSGLSFRRSFKINFVSSSSGCGTICAWYSLEICCPSFTHTILEVDVDKVYTLCDLQFKLELYELKFALGFSKWLRLQGFACVKTHTDIFAPLSKQAQENSALYNLSSATFKNKFVALSSNLYKKMVIPLRSSLFAMDCDWQNSVRRNHHIVQTTVMICMIHWCFIDLPWHWRGVVIAEIRGQLCYDKCCDYYGLFPFPLPFVLVSFRNKDILWIGRT